LLRAQAKASCLKLKIAKLKAKKKKRELEEIITTKELERLENAARMPRNFPLLEPVTRTANSNFLELELLTNLG
jgi:hypothetical protein